MGLEYITEIISNNFKDFSDKSAYKYQYVDNYLNNECLINEKYQHIAFMHQDILDNNYDYNTLLRRVNRFKDLLNQEEKVLFIYYRHYKINFNPKEKNISNYSERLKQESMDFCKKLHGLYPDLKFELLALLQAPSNVIKKISFKNTHLKENGYAIYFNYCPLRFDDDYLEQYSSNFLWSILFLRYNIITIAEFAFCNMKELIFLARQEFNSIKETIKRKRRALITKLKR